MAKLTLLDMVQNILSAMESDEVNSISDTVESLQVAEIVRETYYDLVSTLSIPERKGLVHLESVSDPNRPNYLKIPDSVKNITWVKYNMDTKTYLTPEDFINHVIQQTKNTMTVSDFISVSYPISTDSDPKYYTSFDDKHLAFDSFNINLESTLQGVNSMSLADLNNSFQFENDFVCDLDDNFFPTLLAEAKSACFINLKQVSNANEQSRARRGIVRIQNELNRLSVGKPADRLPDYGRRR